MVKSVQKIVGFEQFFKFKKLIIFIIIISHYTVRGELDKIRKKVKRQLKKFMQKQNFVLLQNLKFTFKKNKKSKHNAPKK